MATAYSRKTSEIRSAGLAIATAGLIAGTLDLAETLIVFGAKSPLVIAAGLLGMQNASRGGAPIYILGVLLHYLIVFSAAAIYFAVSRRLHFLLEHWLLCGLFFGVAIDVVMRMIVLPLSAMHAKGPYQYHELAHGLAAHMILVGLPIAFSVQRFGRVAEPEGENVGR
ncbi:hypothetical protein [Tunturibacter empetritectus]|uniref:DUF1440 domain-containing protein n=1 Tax=Tunturiibacter lichenicola TaxID=2051959 RepID=A0A7W8N650_9BACT|nr:hypothetical protein [Edaphobacter lichenicola]MBB5345226.1 hypothetical protein [Edaphobacter lichenicola]